MVVSALSACLFLLPDGVEASGIAAIAFASTVANGVVGTFVCLSFSHGTVSFSIFFSKVPIFSKLHIFCFVIFHPFNCWNLIDGSFTSLDLMAPHGMAAEFSIFTTIVYLWVRLHLMCFLSLFVSSVPSTSVISTTVIHVHQLWFVLPLFWFHLKVELINVIANHNIHRIWYE
jgi:hypothetical protein